MITAKAIDFDLKKLKAELAKMANAGKPMVVAGVTDGKVMEYAPVQEFGGHGIPSRPFMRTTWEEKLSEWRAGLEASLKEKRDPHTALERVGARMEDDIKATIISSMEPENSVEWQKRKQKLVPTAMGVSSTLYFRGELYKSIIHEVRG